MASIKSVGSSGQITLGKRYAGCFFEVEERANGELLLRPMRIVRGRSAAREQAAPAFEIAEVSRIDMPSRAGRNARR